MDQNHYKRKNYIFFDYTSLSDFYILKFLDQISRVNPKDSILICYQLLKTIAFKILEKNAIIFDTERNLLYCAEKLRSKKLINKDGFKILSIISNLRTLLISERNNFNFKNLAQTFKDLTILFVNINFSEKVVQIPSERRLKIIQGKIESNEFSFI